MAELCWSQVRSVRWRRVTPPWPTALPWRRWSIHASTVGAVLFMACGWGGGAAPPTPIPPPVPSPSPSPSGLLIPPAGIVPSPSPSPSPVAGGESYTVAEGDTLATIASRFYGDENEWRRIFEANHEVIGDNPDNLRIGTVLRIPPRQ
ncbi:MAG: LysM peptidoglycan-binding domain-containing protein [Chloroflexota bacterium]|nr:LysM peptidoglycan-binding domain-containing protein [Chloroflexota bacterium]